MEEFFSAPYYAFSRLIFERSLAFLYFIGFLSAYNQFPALLGEKGLLPVPQFLEFAKFRQAPSLFHWGYSDQRLKHLCLTGMFFSLALVFGLSAHLPIFIHILIWLMLYAFYMSIVNVGQDFYGFGWESMLLEAGFFMAFMGPEWTTPSWIPILILRWMLFRTELGAGLIKIRGDACWRDLTCLYYHYETQPMPNSLSRFFHHGPKWFHKAGVAFSHFVQLIVPFGVFLPQPVAGICGGLIILHQLILVVSGNYSWLNWLTIVLAFLCLPAPGGYIPEAINLMTVSWLSWLQIGLLIFALYLSYHPALNLISKKQKMNYHWNRFHLIGAYGAFGSVTKKRYEIVLEGTTDDEITSQTLWQEYEFKGKPTSLTQIPPQIAPYHLRLDWMMWFLPFSVGVGSRGINVWSFDPWFIRLVLKLLQNNKETLKLIKTSPFLKTSPVFIRAHFYHYQFTNKDEKKNSSNLWKRELLGVYLPPVSMKDLLKIVP